RYVTATRPSRDPARERPGFDGLGQVAVAVALLALTAGVVEGGRRGWGGALPGVLLVVGALAAAGFVFVGARTAYPMVPLGMFGNRSFSAATAVGFVMNFSFYGILFVETLLLERGYGFSAAQAGLALLPQTGLIAVGSWLGGRATGRVGSRVPMAVGMGVGALGYFALVLAGAPYPLLVAPMVAIGFGISFAMPAATSAVVEAGPAGPGRVAAGHAEP